MSGQSSSEREYALLVAQLHALDHDIDAARATARQAAHPRGTGFTFHLHDEPGGNRRRERRCAWPTARRS